MANYWLPSPLISLLSSSVAIGQQLMFCEGNVDSAVKKLMNDNMATMIKNVLKNEPGIRYSDHHHKCIEFGFNFHSCQDAVHQLSWVTVPPRTHE